MVLVQYLKACHTSVDSHAHHLDTRLQHKEKVIHEVSNFFPVSTKKLTPCMSDHTFVGMFEKWISNVCDCGAIAKRWYSWVACHAFFVFFTTKIIFTWLCLSLFRSVLNVCVRIAGLVDVSMIAVSQPYFCFNIETKLKIGLRRRTFVQQLQSRQERSATW